MLITQTQSALQQTIMTSSVFIRAYKKIKIGIEKYRFDRIASAIFNTKPLFMSGDSPVFLSLLCHRDLAPYLLAIKSIYIRFGKGVVKIINDGSLTNNDIQILRHHIPALEIIDINNINTGYLPNGGCWERLIKIIELSKDNYVIQLDADTLTTGPINDIIKHHQDNKSFILGTYSGQEVRPATFTAELAQSWLPSDKTTKLSVGLLAESLLDTLPDEESHYYVHGSAGFAGFAKNQFSIKDLERFSEIMYEIVGTRWHDWGSEQIASNYILANSPEAEVLPISLYACFEPHLKDANRSFLHFIGSYRHNNGTYRREIQKVMKSL